MPKYPQKLANVLQRARNCLETGHYKDTRHATDRQNERKISRLEVQQVLKNGFHEVRKDKFDSNFSTWNYAVRGKTIDGRKLRVIISFDQNDMLIITAIHLK